MRWALRNRNMQTQAHMMSGVMGRCKVLRMRLVKDGGVSPMQCGQQGLQSRKRNLANIMLPLPLGYCKVET